MRSTKGKKKGASTRLTRALSERMYLIRQVSSSTEDEEQRSCYLVTGQSGNVYTVSLPETASEHDAARCNCVDHMIRKTVCKHLIFVCARVLKAPTQLFEAEQSGVGALQQLAKTMRRFLRQGAVAAGGQAGAPAAPAHVQSALKKAVPQLFARRVGRKKVETEDECGICCERLLGEDERLAFCRYGCGRAVHDACFERYRAVTPEVRCVLCRAEWQNDGAELMGRRGLLVGGRLVSVGDAGGGETEADEQDADEQDGGDSDWAREGGRQRKAARISKRRMARASSSAPRAKRKRASTRPRRSARATAMRLRSDAQREREGERERRSAH